MLSGSLSDTISESEGLNNFPDENPNPVMRLSKEGRLLYANLASEPLLQSWDKQLGDCINGKGMPILIDSIKPGSQQQHDFYCGHRVFTVIFAPAAGRDYINLYALEITGKKIVEQALQTALEEVKMLKNRLQQENRYLQDEIKQAHGIDAIIGNSEIQNKLLKKIAQVAKTDATVLVSGETGTGKELLARAIHAASQRKDRPLVKINCAALPAGLIESELFGHEKGAFTGATAQKTGRFELADGGTIFLDEIGDLPLELQAKLLRVLQESEFERVGGNSTISVDVRVIAATNRNLADSIAAGEFREDLFYRLNVFPVQSPPLRHRKKDIALLAHHFLQKYCRKIGKRFDAIEAPVLAQLQAYDWPGNVRELENIIERAIILSEGSSLQLEEAFDLNVTSQSPEQGDKTIKQMEQEMMQSALEVCGWKIEGDNGAAIRLGVAPSTLRERIKKYGLQRKTTGSVKYMPA
jgi:formate hydrogenlyase transcriptional activator